MVGRGKGSKAEPSRCAKQYFGEFLLNIKSYQIFDMNKYNLDIVFF